VIVVTTHAVERYLERINPRLTFEQAEEAILGSARAVEIAARFGCNVVLQGSGAKLILDGERVVTVLRKGSWARSQYPRPPA
jgi:hypothetical protein